VRLILQRRLMGDRAKWRSVCRFVPSDAPKIEAAVRLLASVDLIHWRIVVDGTPMQELSRWDGRVWAPV
jgi:hypothetical protein